MGSHCSPLQLTQTTRQLASWRLDARSLHQAFHRRVCWGSGKTRPWAT